MRHNFVRYVPNTLSSIRLLFSIFIWMIPSQWLLEAFVAVTCTDIFDGLIARRYHVKSRLGSILDPIADKAFACSYTMMLYQHKSLTIPQIILMFSREISLLVFTIVLMYRGQLTSWLVTPTIFGKLYSFLLFSILCYATTYGMAPWGLIVILPICAGLQWRALHVRLKQATARKARHIARQTC